MVRDYLLIIGGICCSPAKSGCGFIEMSSVMLSWWENVMGNENTTEYGLVLVFLIQASTEISDVSKVAFKVLLRGLKNISDRSQIWKLEFRVL